MDDKLRMRFSKTGMAVYMSHLDLMATARRTLLRAGVRLKYSDGFNPHPYISIALPLPVGTSSLCELMDFGVAGGLTPDGLAEILNAVTPGGIGVLEVYLPVRKFSGIKWLRISGALRYDTRVQPGVVVSLNARFKAESIIIAKKTKSGVSDTDIVPLIHKIQFSAINDDSIAVDAVISAQNPSLSPDSLINALSGDFSKLAPVHASFTRTEIFDENYKIFR